MTSGLVRMGKLYPVEQVMKGCPFCGGEGKVSFSHELGRWDIYEVECISCVFSLDGPTGFEGDKAKQAAITAWNTRIEATPAVDREGVARLCLRAMFSLEYEGDSLIDETERVFSEPNPKAVRAVNLADAILALPPVKQSDGWKDISTAPKDGTEILAWCVHPNAEYAGTIAEKSEWQGPVVTRWIDHNGGGWTWHGMLGRFTHWQPLPAPPAIRSLDITRMDSDV